MAPQASQTVYSVGNVHSQIQQFTNCIWSTAACWKRAKGLMLPGRINCRWSTTRIIHEYEISETEFEFHEVAPICILESIILSSIQGLFTSWWHVEFMNLTVLQWTIAHYFALFLRAAFQACPLVSCVKSTHPSCLSAKILLGKETSFYGSANTPASKIMDSAIILWAIKTAGCFSHHYLLR
jgi:hypothetical protein